MVHLVPQLPSGLREGDVVARKYRIDAIIGAGAMGVVVGASHLLLEEKVAIKFLLPQALGNADATARFLREAQAAVRIKSEHIARVFDVATLDDGTPYIVMEYLEGSDLAEILRQRGALPVDQAVEFVLQACEAIVEAHELGIVHRDLKPANLFVVRRADGLYSVKVLDFGISKTLGVDPASANIAITDTTVVMGSPAYMSPEQMESARKVDAQTDVWALGAILCELVTGKIPFDGQSLPEVYTKIVSQPAPSLREWSPSLPAGLEDVILKCLKKNRALRYRNVGDLALAVLEFAPKRAAASVERIARTLEASKLPPSDSDPLTGAPWSPRTISGTRIEKTLCSWGDPVPAKKKSRPKGLRVGLAAALAAALAASAIVAVTTKRAAPPETHAAALITPAEITSTSLLAPPPLAPLESEQTGAQRPERAGAPRPSLIGPAAVHPSKAIKNDRDPPADVSRIAAAPAPAGKKALKDAPRTAPSAASNHASAGDSAAAADIDPWLVDPK